MEYNDKNLLALDGQGLSYKQIAAELHVTTSVVGGRLRRIKKKNPELVLVRRKPEKKTVRRVAEPMLTIRVPKKQAPNKNTWALGNKRQVQLSKAEMYQQLKKAVENTR